MAPAAVAPAELLWRKWLLLAATPVAGLVIAATAWTLFWSSNRPEAPLPPVVAPPDEVLPVVEKPQHPEGARPGRRAN